MIEKKLTFTRIILMWAIIIICDCLTVTCQAWQEGQNDPSASSSSCKKPLDCIDEDEYASDGALSPEEAKIIDATEKLRGLSAENKFAPIYQTEDELRQYLIEQLKDSDDEDLKNELALYYILGFAPKDFDLRQFYVDMYTEQIAGFFDQKTNQMHLIENESSYDNALTLAHEYTHFLQYNNPNFPQTLKHDDDYCKNNPENCLVIDALIEGDATLTETLLNPQTILGNRQSSGKKSGNVLYSAPKFFQDTLLFPYKYGFDFVSYHYLKGGFTAVNDLYMKPPQSIEQIMHPEKYPADAPVDVSVDSFRSLIVENGFEIKRETVLNESDIKLILCSGYKEEWQLSERQAEIAAAGWGGGSYIYAEKDGKQLFFSKVLWDNVQDAEEAETIFELYSNKRFGEQTADKVWAGENGAEIYLIRQDDILFWMILPDNIDKSAFIDMIQENRN